MSSNQAFYDQFPFPGDFAGQGDSEIGDLANGIQTLFPGARLDGTRVLDVGCGTGQRLMSLARRYPETRFTGVDISAVAIAHAREHAARAGLHNIDWRVNDLARLAASGASYDLVIATGLIHHLSDPQAGIADLARVLAPGGVMYVWLFHAIGEHDRLRQRELARLFCPDAADAARMVQVSDALSLQLPDDHYGPRSVSPRHDGELLSHAVVDAFFHPSVAAFRFDGLRELLRGAGLGWYSVHSINVPGASVLLNLGEAKGLDCLFALKVGGLLGTEALRKSYASFSVEERLRVVELLMKPTGFTFVTGRPAALGQFSERIQKAACPLAAASAEPAWVEPFAKAA